ncbi:hypothetical protein FOA52_012702 [Chlamydomonas sp. UWO 241]|nr:hypothetical protein FOA52_012702 [Chlamydomonas sp. UWO 241]
MQPAGSTAASTGRCASETKSWVGARLGRASGAVPRPAAAPPLLQPLRMAVVVNTVKNPGVSTYDDVKPGQKTKPMQRAESEFDLEKMVNACGEWRGVAQLATESPHKFESSPELSVHALLRVSKLLGPLRKLPASERAAAKAFVDSLCAMLVRNLAKSKGQGLCGAVLALKRLGYKQTRLLKALFLFLEHKEMLAPVEMPGAPPKLYSDGTEMRKKKHRLAFTLSERVAMLMVVAQMGVRPPPEALSMALINCYPFLKWSEPSDLTNLLGCLRAWRATVSMRFVGRLFAVGRDALHDLPIGTIVALAEVSGRAGYTASGFASQELLRALEPHIAAGLPSPRDHASLMAALMRMRVSVPPETYDVLACALMEPVKAGGKLRMESLGAAELCAIAASLGVQEMYTPEPSLVACLLSCLQARASELSPPEAAGAVRLLPALLTTSDAADDACEVVDELLAVIEGGMGEITAAELHGLCAALGQLSHKPDAFWAGALHAEMLARASAPVAGVDGAKGVDGATGVDRIPGGRPSLVELLAAAAKLPASAAKAKGSKAAASPALKLARKVLSRGAALGGFNNVQAASLSTSLSTLGLDSLTGSIDRAADALGAALDEGLERGSDAGDAAKDDAVRAAGEAAAQAAQFPPGEGASPEQQAAYEAAQAVALAALQPHSDLRGYASSEHCVAGLANEAAAFRVAAAAQAELDAQAAEYGGSGGRLSGGSGMAAARRQQQQQQGYGGGDYGGGDGGYDGVGGGQQQQQSYDNGGGRGQYGGGGRQQSYGYEAERQFGGDAGQWGGGGSGGEQGGWYGAPVDEWAADSDQSFQGGGGGGVGNGRQQQQQARGREQQQQQPWEQQQQQEQPPREKQSRGDDWGDDFGVLGDNSWFDSNDAATGAAPSSSSSRGRASGARGGRGGGGSGWGDFSQSQVTELGGELDDVGGAFDAADGAIGTSDDLGWDAYDASGAFSGGGSWSVQVPLR